MKHLIILFSIIIPLSLTAEETRVACIGDSITFGAGIANPAQNSYPAQLQRMLGDGWQVRNFGHSGCTVTRDSVSGWGRGYVKQIEHTNALAFQPNVVICNLGINDVSGFADAQRQHFVRDYSEIIAAYRALPTHPRIIIWQRLAPLYPGQSNYGRPVVTEINQLIRKVADLTGAETVDMTPPLSNHPEWFPDHIHPNADGAIVIARTVFESLTGKKFIVPPLSFYDPATATGEGNFNTDWAGFKATWEKRQKDFAAGREADRDAVVFLGDSITEIAPLKKLFPTLHVANRGISGDTSRGMIYRLRDNVLDLNPSAVVLLCGANDMMQPGSSATATAANVKTICQTIHAAKPGIKVYALKIMPNKKTGLPAVEQFNTAVDHALEGLSYVVRVDTFSPFLKPDGGMNEAAFYDGTHPGPSGFEIFRQTMAPVLEAESKNKK